ncbi:MAG: 4'-phosphopantetheinyl transferase superfamily protein [Muribaculaceae bacterium]|nr:4'-phosphopantetheinyl transferase superfamily protein [Muribaculaceae bacterium]
MTTEFIYWRHDTSVGVRVEELSGCEDKSPKLWKILALQVFGENGGERYREVGHYPSGAPYLEDSVQRISISHTPHFMVVASLPRTPEAHLDEFNTRTAMGIDTEKSDREQALNVAARVMNEAEIELMDSFAYDLSQGSSQRPAIPEKTAKIRSAVLAWTIKEALYKAALEEGIDFKNNLRILKFPEICSGPLVKSPILGHAEIDLEGIPGPIEMKLFSYLSEGHIVTIALSSKCATFKKK